MIKLYNNNEISKDYAANLYRDFMKKSRWSFTGKVGYPDEPFRHWACQTVVDKYTRDKCMEVFNDKLRYILEKEAGHGLDMFSILVNQFNHGDSSWLHKDISADYTCILYLNPEWNINWGGFTIFTNEDKDIINFTSYPKCGTFVFFDSSILHGATAVGREAKVPRMAITYQMKRRRDDK